MYALFILARQMRLSDKRADMIHKCKLVPPSNLCRRSDEAVVGRTEQVLSSRPRWRAGDCRWSNKVESGGGGCLAVGLCLFAVREGLKGAHCMTRNCPNKCYAVRTEQLQGNFREVNVYCKRSSTGETLPRTMISQLSSTRNARSLLRRRLHKRDL